MAGGETAVTTSEVSRGLCASAAKHSGAPLELNELRPLVLVGTEVR